MSTRYIVAVDGSDAGWKAMDMAVRLAGEAEAELIVVHVVPYEPVPDAIEQWARTEGMSGGEIGARFHQDRAIADGIIREAGRRAREAGMDDVTFKAPEGSVAKELVNMASDYEAEMIFLGSRGLSDLQGMLLGSVSHKVTERAGCTCITVR